MKKLKKLTVLDFKKEQLVNLNDEEMIHIKGGTTTWPCIFRAITYIASAVSGAVDLTWIGSPCRDDVFEYTDVDLGLDITCATADWITIYG